MKPLLLMQTGDAPEVIRQEKANFDGMFLQQGNIDVDRVQIVHLPAGEQPLPPHHYRRDFDPNQRHMSRRNPAGGGRWPEK